MKQRWIAWGLALLSALTVIAAKPSSRDLLADSDTQAIFAQLEQRNAPLTWFVTDWPLQNHFYRPVSTLTFELDRLFGETSGALAWSQAIWCGICVLALFWFLREATSSLVLAALGSFVFASWHFPVGLGVGGWAVWIALVITGAAFVVGRRLPEAIIAGCSAWYFVFELGGIDRLVVPLTWHESILGWVPARTAIVSCAFGLLSLAAFTRGIRSTEAAANTDATPTEPPATRNTKALSQQPKSGLMAISVVCLAFALLAYEQAVSLLPAFALIPAFMKHIDHRRKRQFWLSASAVLVAYVALRLGVVPASFSDYQVQSLRGLAPAAMGILAYLFPGAVQIPAWTQSFGAGWAAMLTASFYRPLVMASANLVALAAVRDTWRLPALGICLSLAAYLPVALLSPFAHYHYLSMALRTLFVATLGAVTFAAFLTAMSPRPVQAPSRLHPAPGSLPRR